MSVTGELANQASAISEVWLILLAFFGICAGASDGEIKPVNLKQQETRKDTKVQSFFFLAE